MQVKIGFRVSCFRKYNVTTADNTEKRSQKAHVFQKWRAPAGAKSIKKAITGLIWLQIIMALMLLRQVLNPQQPARVLLIVFSCASEVHIHPIGIDDITETDLASGSVDAIITDPPST